MEPSELKDVPLFSELSRRDLKIVAEHADEVDVASGKTLIEQGRLAYEFFVITEGTADVFHGDEKIADVTQFEPMPYYQWTESMSVGLPLLDEDHKALIRLINRLHAGLAAGVKFGELEDIFDRLVAYIEFHFTREEKVMEAGGYPFAAAHREEHEGFTQAIYEMRDRYAREGDQTMTAELPDYLKNWLNHHILVQDMAYKPYVQNNPLADKVAGAFGSWFEEDEKDEYRAIRHPLAAIDSDRYGRARAAARGASTLDRKAGP